MRADGPVTGAMLRDLVVCERRAWHDAHTDDDLRDEVGSFVQLLWAEGTRHEADVLERLDGRVVDLRDHPAWDRRRATTRALVAGDVDHVLGAEIVHEDLLGRPDVISRIDGRWVAGDAKSGSPHMPDGVRVREEYGVQIGLYARILQATALGDGDRAFVIGPDGERALFDLHAAWGRSTMAEIVSRLVIRARDISEGLVTTRGEASAKCGLCHWRTVCRGELERADDLTLVAELGRKLREVVEEVAPDRAALADLDVDAVAGADGRPGLPGLGVARLTRFRDRARLQKTPGAGPYARVPLGLARAPLEWHLDIESDPTSSGHVYLHGVWERRLEADGSEATLFHHFFADGPDGERRAFADVWALLNSDPTAMIYYYSPFERVSYRALQRRHPGVCGAEEIEAFFADPRVVDLYTAVVRPHTEWPLSSYGIKPIAKHCGFSWSQEDASGASSIAWFVEYRETGDPAVRDRIIDYNRSDCIASAIVLDALIGLPVGAPPWPPEPPEDADEHVEDDEFVFILDEDQDEGWHDDEDRAYDRDRDRDLDGDGDAWRAEGEALRTFFDELEDGGGNDVAPRSHHRVTSAPIYSTPTLMVCRGRTGGSSAFGVDSPWRSLAEHLPLAGAAAFTPAGDGGFALTERLRDVAPWMGPAISAIERSLRLGSWAGRPWLAWRPMVLVGDAGVGKSWFAREVARASEVPLATADLGAAPDALNLAGVASGWSSAMPCWPARAIAENRVANPILVADEIEKTGGIRDGNGGRVHDALLGMLEPGTASGYPDRCLLADVDLSAVCWMFTANDLGGLPSPLLNRLDVIEASPPGPEHFELLRANIAADLAARWGVPTHAMPELPSPIVDGLRRAFDRHRSARLLRAHLERLLPLAAPNRPQVLH